MYLTNTLLSYLKNKIASSNILYYSILSYIICSIIRIPVHLVKYIFNIHDIHLTDNLYQKLINPDTIIDTLLLAPLLETFLFQTLFYFLHKKYINRKTITIILSGASFAAIHYYSFFYMIDTFFIGIFFMYGYIARAGSDNKPYISTFIAHAFINLITTLLLAIKLYF